MKPVSRADGPRAEVSAALPTVPPPVSIDRATRADVASSVAALRRAEKDEPAAKAALAMLGDESAAIDRIATIVAAANTDRSGLYGLAVRLDGEGNAVGAADVLCVLAGLAGGSAAGYLGLAVLAMRDARMDLAAALLAPALDSENRHPRACSIAGIIELARGNRSAAQAWLAAASRIARRRPEFRPEMQLAQRALLLMHLG
jgi:Flp pilus assembly protein TadD